MNAPPIIEQARAKYCVVEASAGTGKTFFLEHKFVDLIAQGAKVDQIVVVTFTEAATAELRARIRELLAQYAEAAEPSDAPDRAVAAERLAAAYRDFDAAPIHTIHGFCQRLLAQYQPGFGATKANADLRTIVAHALPAVLRRQLAANGDVAAWVAEKGISQLAAVVTQACGAALMGRSQAPAQGALDRVVAAMVPPLLDEITEVKERALWFEFQDLLQEAAALIAGADGQATSTAAAVRAAHPWALIDEFQDTDALQWQIFAAIWRHPDAQGLTVVGDPKQSIYEFRGANLAVYQQACAALIADGGKALSLLGNFRSSPGVVAAYNQICSSGLFSRLAYHAVEAKAEPAPALIVTGAPQTMLPPMVQWQASDDMKERRAQICHAVVDEVLWLCGRRVRPGSPAPRLARGELERDLGFGDIMILSPRNGDLDELATALRAAGIPASLRTRQSVWASEIAQELRWLLAAVAAPRDQGARMRALQTRFFPLAEAPLFDDADPCVGWIFAWHGLAREGTLGEMFAQLVATSRVCERLMASDGGLRAVADLRHLIEACLTHAATAGTSIVELATYVAARCQDAGSDADADGGEVRIELDGAAVRLLTCHKAKGLEAPVVMVVSFQSKAHPQHQIATFERDGRAWFTVGMKEYGDAEGKELAKRAYVEERERLAYVALTRAQVRTYVVGPRVSAKGELASDEFYQPIWRAMRAAALDETLCQRVDLAVPSDAPGEPSAMGGSPSPVVAALPMPISVGAAQQWPPRWRASQRGLRLASYSSLKATGGEGDALPLLMERAISDEASSEWAAPRGQGGAPPSHGMEEGATRADGLPPGRETGLFLHKLLELAPMPLAIQDASAWAATREVAAAVARAQQEFALAPEYVDQALAVVHRACSMPLPLPHRPRALRDAERMARELSFMVPVAPHVILGVLDVLCEFDGRLWVIDYKSDVVAGADADAAARHVAAHYGLQQMVYATAALRLAGIRDQEGFARRFGGVGFLMLRTGHFVATSPSWEDAQQWQGQVTRRLEALS